MVVMVERWEDEEYGRRWAFQSATFRCRRGGASRLRQTVADLGWKRELSGECRS